MRRNFTDFLLQKYNRIFFFLGFFEKVSKTFSNVAGKFPLLKVNCAIRVDRSVGVYVSK